MMGGESRQSLLVIVLLAISAAGISLALSSPWPLVWLAMAIAWSMIVRGFEVAFSTDRHLYGLRALLPLAIIVGWVPRTATEIESAAVTSNLLFIASLQLILAASPLLPQVTRMIAWSSLGALLLLSFTITGGAFLLIAAATVALSALFWMRDESLSFPRRFLREGDGTRRSQRRLARSSKLYGETRRTDRRALRIMLGGSFWIGLLLFALLPRIRVSDMFAQPPEADVVAPGIRAEAPGESSGNGGGGDLPDSADLGFREDAFLANVGRIDEDDSIALRIEMSLPDGTPYDPGPFLWIRGVLLDTYVDNRFVNSTQQRFVVFEDADDGDDDGWTHIRDEPLPNSIPVAQTIELMATDTDALFGLREPIRVQLARALRDPQGNLRFSAPSQEGRSYRLDSRVVPGEPRRLRGAAIAPVWEGYLDVPPTVSRVRDLARRVRDAAGARTPWETCAAIELYLQDNLEYTLAFDSADDTDLVDHFLFTTRAGYCVHFAAAMTLMLRSLDIPSRMAAGYATDERGTRPGEFLARASDSHAWVEVPFRGFGWIRFDPTPYQEDEQQAADLWATLTDFLDGFSEADRRALMEAVSRLLHPVATWLLLAAVIAFLAGKRLRRGKRRGDGMIGDPAYEATSFYADFLDRLARGGVERRPAETPWQLAVRACRWFPREAVELITRRFCETRYGRRRLEDAERQELQAALRRIERRDEPDGAAV